MCAPVLVAAREPVQLVLLGHPLLAVLWTHPICSNSLAIAYLIRSTAEAAPGLVLRPSSSEGMYERILIKVCTLHYSLLTTHATKDKGSHLLHDVEVGEAGELGPDVTRAVDRHPPVLHHLSTHSDSNFV